MRGMPPPNPFGAPRFPFTGWPTQIAHPDIGYVWFVAPCFFLDQAHLTQATVASAHALHDLIDRALAARRADIEAAGGLVCIHDWRALRGYDAPARRAYQERMRARPKGYLKTAYTIVPSTPLFRMAIEAGGLAAQLGSGGRILLATDPAPILAKLGIAPPAPGEPFPGE